MIKSLIYVILAIAISLFDAFVFMFGWNTIVHQIGFPTIGYGLSYGICLFIGYVKTNEIGDKECEDRREYIRNKVVMGIVNSIVYLVFFFVLKMIMGY